MMNEKGDFVGEVCHIEAAQEDGERFNPDITNETRRAFDNLLLMCHDHHVETDNVDDFPVQRVVEIKGEHERAFRLRIAPSWNILPIGRQLTSQRRSQICRNSMRYWISNSPRKRSMR